MSSDRLSIDYPGDAARGLLRSVISEIFADVSSERVSSEGRRQSAEPGPTSGPGLPTLVILVDNIHLLAPRTPRNQARSRTGAFAPSHDDGPSSGGRADGDDADEDAGRVLAHLMQSIQQEARSGCQTGHQTWPRKVAFVATCSEQSAVHGMVASRFERILHFEALNSSERRECLLKLMRNCRLMSGDQTNHQPSDSILVLPVETDICHIADNFCHGFMASDVAAVVKNVEQVARQFCTLQPATSRLDISSLLKRMVTGHAPLMMAAGSQSSIRKSAGSISNTVLAAGVQNLPAVTNVADYRPRVEDSPQPDSLIRASDAADDEPPRKSDGFKAGNNSLVMKPSSPHVHWDDIGGQDAAKLALQQMVLWPLIPEKAAAMRALGVQPPTGILLYGPPGTGKTLLAKAVASTLGARFVNIPIPSIIRAGVGDSERALAAAFAVATAAAPAVIFIDEIQALFASRSSSGGGGDDESSRMAGMLTSQLVLSLDRIRTGSSTSTTSPDAKSKRVIVIAATNVPEAVDSALLQPGRFDRCVYVGLPTLAERESMIGRLLETMEVRASNDGREPESLQDASRRALARTMAFATDGCSGADIANLFRCATSLAIQDRLQASLLPSSTPSSVASHETTASVSDVALLSSHLTRALQGFTPSSQPIRVRQLQRWRPNRHHHHQ